MISMSFIHFWNIFRIQANVFNKIILDSITKQIFSTMQQIEKLALNYSDINNDAIEFEGNRVKDKTRAISNILCLCQFQVPLAKKEIFFLIPENGS